MGQRRRVSSTDASFAFVPPRCKRVPRLRAFSGRRRDVFVGFQADPPRWNARDLSEDFFRFARQRTPLPCRRFRFRLVSQPESRSHPCFPPPGGREFTSIFADRTTPLPTHVRRKPAAPSLRAVLAHLALYRRVGSPPRSERIHIIRASARWPAFRNASKAEIPLSGGVTRAPVQSTNFDTSRTYEA